MKYKKPGATPNQKTTPRAIDTLDANERSLYRASTKSWHSTRSGWAAK